MLKMLFGAVVIAWLTFAVVGGINEDNRQGQREVEQGRLLAEMEALRNPDVSRLVDDWRRAYPVPSEDRLTELRVLVERVKADPASAAKHTTAEKQKKIDALPFESPFGNPKAKPGI